VHKRHLRDTPGSVTERRAQQLANLLSDSATGRRTTDHGSAPSTRWHRSHVPCVARSRAHV